MSPGEPCAEIARGLPPLFTCAPAPQEGVRIRTPFLYPDGGVADDFAIPRGERWFLTDHGEALGWLRMQSARGRLSENQ